MYYKTHLFYSSSTQSHPDPVTLNPPALHTHTTILQNTDGGHMGEIEKGTDIYTFVVLYVHLRWWWWW